MNKLIKQLYYRNEDDGAGSGGEAPAVGADGTIQQEVQKQEPKYLTEDALESKMTSFADRIIAGLAPRQEQAQYDPTEGLEEALIDPDKMVAYLANYKETIKQELRQEQSGRMSLTDAVEAIAGDSDKEVRKEVASYLKKLDPSQYGLIAQNEDAIETVIAVAEKRASKAQGTPPPGSKEPGTSGDNGWGGLDGEGIKDVEMAMRAFGLSKKDAIAAYKKGAKN